MDKDKRQTENKKKLTEDKKKQTEDKKLIFGRTGNTLKMGIVGLPNVGKSTTFNLLSNQNVPAENFMFCTVDPNIARVEVPDHRFSKLVKHYEPKSEVCAYLNIVDIAGLVRGASRGQGMGSAFLSHIQAVDGIYHVVRAFDDEDILHYDGEVDPIRDLETIKFELIEKDKLICEKRLEEAEIRAKRNNQDKQAIVERNALVKVKSLLDDFKNIREISDWNYKEIDYLNSINFFTAKPVVYLINMSEKDYISKRNKYLTRIVRWVKENGDGKIIPYSAAFESRLFESSKEEKDKIIEETKCESALGKLIINGYDALDLIHYFTVGEDEVKCWTIRKGCRAPEAAGIIHTDFERGFISADVTKFDDFERLGGEAEIKKEGKIRFEGKAYEVQDGDIIHFKFNVSDPKKKK